LPVCASDTALSRIQKVKANRNLVGMQAHTWVDGAQFPLPAFGVGLVIGRETDAGAHPSLLQLMPPGLLLEGGSRTSVYLTEMLFWKRG
jgi:hypothetical protein